VERTGKRKEKERGRESEKGGWERRKENGGTELEKEKKEKKVVKKNK
jgi:hypothetical protein